jgi:hypothetical protein
LVRLCTSHGIQNKSRNKNVREKHDGWGPVTSSLFHLIQKWLNHPSYFPSLLYFLCSPHQHQAFCIISSINCCTSESKHHQETDYYLFCLPSFWERCINQCQMCSW